MGHRPRPQCLVTASHKVVCKDAALVGAKQILLYSFAVVVLGEHESATQSAKTCKIQGTSISDITRSMHPKPVSRMVDKGF